jgi:hypothetical protein
MQSAEVKAIFSDWMLDSGVDCKHVKTLISFVFMNKDKDIIFSKSTPDTIMCREITNVNRKMSRFLAFACDATRSAFASAFFKAHRFFKAWTTVDKQCMLAHVIQLIVQSKRDGAQEPPAEWMGMVRQLAGESGVERATAAFNTHVIIDRGDLMKTVTETARRAFWDIVRSEIDESKFDGMYNILSEMREAMLALNAHSERTREKIDDTFDVAWIRQRIEMGVMSIDELHALMLHIARTITEWQAPADVFHSEEWVQRLADVPASDMASLSEFASAHLVDFLEEAHGQLGRIYARVLEIDATSLAAD